MIASGGGTAQEMDCLWLRQAMALEGTPCPLLLESCRADVAIVGGGYVGLWTAIEIKRREPNLNVVVLEQDACGSGASGRNGGYVLSWWPKAQSLSKKWGRDAARDLIRRSEQAIVDLATFCEREMIAAEMVRCGWVWGAESQTFSGAWISAVEECDKLGVGDFRLLDRTAVAEQTGTHSSYLACWTERQPCCIRDGLCVECARLPSGAVSGFSSTAACDGSHGRVRASSSIRSWGR